MKERGIWDESEGGEAGEKRVAVGGRRKREKKKVSIEEFELIRVLGRGCAGKVSLGETRSRKEVERSKEQRLTRLLLFFHQVLLVRQKTSSTSTLMAMVSRLLPLR